MFYTKDSKGDFVPVEFEQVLSKDWDNKMVVVRVGTDELPVTEEELISVTEGLADATVARFLDSTSFLVTAYALSFQVLGSTNEIKSQPVAIRITGADDLSKLGGLQKEARDQLRGKVGKVVVIPGPLTVGEYQDVMAVKQRCDLRRSRRGR